MKKKKDFVSFNKGWDTKYDCFKKSHKGERFAFCTTYANDFGIGYGGENDIKRHLKAPKHESKVKSLKSSHSLAHGLEIIYSNK